ncbi:ribonuclease H1 domain-containing protein [Veillonella intestinalis]|uniref:ribonuclease H1 domain-containing protein n=1 Tax=Veillonella intestinalis TaxID=2941341 RepID=UPI0020424321|nr:ribonuclease H family protein [Veillonella intestinalis]
MGKKYYAVKEGRVRGIFDSWAACERQVKGYGGAIYKSFTSRQDAEDFMADEVAPIKGMSMAEYLETAKASTRRSSRRKKVAEPEATPAITAESILAELGPRCMLAYIDGSFDKVRNVVGAGGIMFYEGQEETFSFGTDKEMYTAYWNVAGELLGAMHVIKTAIAKQIKEVHIYYDYMGIEMWATGRWKANNPLTKAYAEFTLNSRRQVKTVFHKVAAHTGVVYNEKADELAKAGTTKLIDL